MTATVSAGLPPVEYETRLTLLSMSWNWSSIRPIAAIAFALLTFATFFIVEHSLTMSLTSENGSDEAFEEVDLDSMVESGTALRKLGFLSFGAVGLALMAIPGRPLNWGTVSVWAALMFVLWLASSVVWAADSSLCLRRVIVVGMMALGVAGWCRLTTPDQTVRVLGTLVLAFIGLGLLCELALFQFRPWSSGYRFGGTTHPNTQGVLLAIGTFYAAVRAWCRTERGRLLWAGLAVVLFVGLVLTKSRTTLAAAVLALSVLWLLRASWPQRLVGILGGFVALTGVLFASLMFNVDAVSGAIDALLLGRAEEVSTLTGRTPLWAELNRDIAERPLHGYGFGSFWTPDVVYRVKQNQGWQIPHAHSAYYETTLNLGLVGLLLAVVGVASAGLRGALRDSRDNVASGMTVAVTSFAAVYSLTDTAFGLPTFASFALALIVLQSSRLGTAFEQPLPTTEGSKSFGRQTVPKGAAV